MPLKLKTAAFLLISLIPALSSASEQGNGVTIEQGYAAPFTPEASPAHFARHASYPDDRYYAITGLDLTLYRDRDHDGYFSAFELITDVDVEYGSAQVWLEIWIRPYGGYYEHLLSSDPFIIEGAAAADTYIIDASLDYDIPADYYDILIELHSSSVSGSPVAFADDYSDAALSQLPLESTRTYQDSSSVYVSAYGAGAGGPALLAVGLIALLLRRRRTI